MARSSTFDLYNRILKGKFPQMLADWRAEGLSLEEIAYRLRDIDVQATANTVGRWLKEQGITPAVGSATDDDEPAEATG